VAGDDIGALFASKLVFSDDGQYLAAAGLTALSGPERVVVYDVTTPESPVLVSNLTGMNGDDANFGRLGPTIDLRFSGSGAARIVTAVAGAAADNTLMSWRVSDGAPIAAVPTPAAFAGETAVAISADHQLVATKSNTEGDSDVRVRNLIDGALVLRVPAEIGTGDPFTSFPTPEVTFVGTPATVFAVGGADGRARMYYVDHEVGQITTRQSVGAGVDDRIAVSRSGTRIAFESPAGIVKVVDVRDDAAARTLSGSAPPLVPTGPNQPVEPVKLLAISGDGRFVADITRGAPGVVLSVWDANSGALRFQQTTDRGAPPNALLFSPDGATVMFVDHAGAHGADDGAAELFDTTTGALRLRVDSPFHGFGFDMPFFSADGESFAVHTEGAFRFYDARSGEPGASFGGGLQATSVSVAPDGRIAVGLSGHDIVLFDAHGDPLARYETRDLGSPSAIAFSANGRTLAATFPVGAQLWDTRNTFRVGTPLPTITPSSAVAFGVSDARLVTIAGTEAAIHELGLGRWTETACRLAARDLSEEELRRFGAVTNVCSPGVLF